VWAELNRQEVQVAEVGFCGRGGRGGQIEGISLSRLPGGERVDLRRWPGRGELEHGLTAPVWDRYGTFTGQPLIRGTVKWTTADRRVVITGVRGDQRFEEIVK